MPETRPTEAPRMRLVDSYKVLFGNTAFNCYLLMLIGGLAGIAVFEASSGVLMGGVLGLNSMTVSILFILPIPAAFFRRVVCRSAKQTFLFADVAIGDQLHRRPG